MTAADLDSLAARLVREQGVRFAIASTEAEKVAGFRLRAEAVAQNGWQADPTPGNDLERDGYDGRALHIVGWSGSVPVATGRLVFPPGRLPTEEASRITVEPRGRVVDVGRMVVCRTHQSSDHQIFTGLLASLYLEVRRHDFEVACGMMSAATRMLMRILGLELEILGDEQPYWNELRAPVRFSLR